MPLFLINARDKANAAELRQATRSAHLEWAKEAADMLIVVGPVLSDDDTTMIGSTFIVEGESLEAVRAWQATDPYVKAGLFETVEIRPFRWVIGSGKRPD